MHVLHVINALSGGGAETSLREILVGTAGADLRHTLVVLDPEGNVLDGLGEAGVEVVVPGRRLVSWRQRIQHVRQALRRCQPDLVHTTLFDADVAGRVAARAAAVPCLTSLVNTPYTPEAMAASGVPRWKTAAVRAIDRALAHHATSAFHAISHATATAGVRDLRIDPGRIHVVPRGRDTGRLGAPSPERRRRVRDRLGLSVHRPVVTNVARQEPQKGLVHLLEAMAILVDRVPDALLLQVGRPGNSTRQLEERIEQLQLGDNVMLLGRRTDIGDLLAASDVFAFPSLYEGLGGAVLEAMAMGLPIAASDIPALREVLDDGRCGALTPPGAAPRLAHELTRLLTDDDLAAELAARARVHFAHHYDLPRCLAGMRDLYHHLGAASRRPVTRQDSTC